MENKRGSIWILILSVAYCSSFFEFDIKSSCIEELLALVGVVTNKQYNLLSSTQATIITFRSLSS